MPNNTNKDSSIYKLNQHDIFGDGKDNSTPANAGGAVISSLADGQAKTTASIDGNLALIANPLTIDPTDNISGNANFSYTRAFLLRWIVKLIQGISAKLPALSNGKIPVDAGAVTAYDMVTTQTSVSGTAYVAITSGAATRITVLNQTGVEISLAKGGTGAEIRLPDQAEITLPVLSNANEWSVKRTDSGTVRVNVTTLRITA